MAVLSLSLNSDMNGKGKLEIQGSHTMEAFLAEVLRDVKAPGGATVLGAISANRKDVVADLKATCPTKDGRGAQEAGRQL